MKVSPQLLILETAIGLFERQFQPGSAASRDDLLVLGRQLHRLNTLYIRLAEAALDAAWGDRVSD
jgi:hypothetical protein